MNSFEFSNCRARFFVFLSRVTRRCLQDLFFGLLHFLHVDGAHHFFTVGHRGFFKCLTVSQFFDNAGFLKFSFEFFECFFDVFAFFYRYYYHIFLSFKFPSTNCGAKLKHCFLINKPFPEFFFAKKIFSFPPKDCPPLGPGKGSRPQEIHALWQKGVIWRYYFVYLQKTETQYSIS